MSGSSQPYPAVLSRTGERVRYAAIHDPLIWFSYPSARETNCGESKRCWLCAETFIPRVRDESFGNAV